MYKGKRICVIITAGGTGQRMKSPLPKQYMKIKGIPMIKKAVIAFQENEWVDRILITTSPEYKELCGELLSDITKLTAIVEGGKERQDSVANGLRELNRKETFDYVMIHDAARPYVTDEIICDSIMKAVEVGAAVAAVPTKDTIRSGAMTLERENLHIIQTPQTFEKSIIMRAHEKAAGEKHYGSDDGGLVERLGLPVALSKGDYTNIKITTPEDFPVMERIGKGYDVHRLVPGRRLILGGVEIAHRMGLEGHSDADVLIHAVMDSLLGAAALGDIGKHFPDSDPNYKDISSCELLKRTKELISDAGYVITNIDATVIAQEPKIAPYIDTMRNNLSAILAIDKDSVSIKATTTEKLGFVGREEGIAAESVCLITTI